MNFLLFIIAFIICLTSYIIHTLCHIYESNPNLPSPSKTTRKIISLIIDTGYIAWGFMMAFDPSQMNLPTFIILPLGLVIGIVGFILFLSSIITKKGFEDVDHLVTYGIYTKIRHPMYVGTILIHFGFPLAFGKYFTLLSAILWIPQVFFWRYLEEKHLEKRFGQEYIEYRKRTFF